MAAEGYERFLDFDWDDERWKAYLDGLFPPPNPKQTLKFKRKWYKKNIDPDFDDKYDPTPPSPPSGTAAGKPQDQQQSTLPPIPSAAFSNGTKWRVMGMKGTICFSAYAAALVMATGAFAGVFPAYQPLLVLIGAFSLDLIAKYGIKFSTQYMQFVLLDDVGAMPIMVITLLMPGMHSFIRTFVLSGPCLSALLSLSQICKNHKALPAWARDFFSPLAEPAARFKVMRVRGYVEVFTGFLLVVAVFVRLAAPFAGLMYWNVMMMRYMMSYWTQRAFEDIDGVLKPRCDKVPGVKQGYAAIKEKMYSFVDPESKSAGRLCTIM